MKPPVFIVGCDRSGTTLLRLMLIQNPELFIPTETDFLTKLRHRAEEYGDFTSPAERFFFLRDLELNDATLKTKTFSVFHLTVEEAEEAIHQAAPTDFPGASAALYQAAAKKIGGSRWGDKTPAYIREMDWVASAFPRAQFVHIIRDGRDVVSSMVKARFARSTINGIEKWTHRVQKGRAVGKTLGPSRYTEIFYEKLLHEPESELKRICEFLGMDYHSDMLNYYEGAKRKVAPQHLELFPLLDKPVDASRAYAWKKTMNSVDLADCERIGGTLLKELGYEISGANVPVARRFIRWMRDRMSPILEQTYDMIRGL